MSEITFSSQVHPTEQIVLDFAAENLQPNSVWLPLVLQAELPNDTMTKEFKKKGKLTRQILGENAASTYQAYTETKTTLAAVKSVVSVRTSVESLDFSPGDLDSDLGIEAGKAFAVGIDEDIADLIISATRTQAHSGADFLKMIDILAAALKCRNAMGGQQQRIAFCGHQKQVHEAFGEDLLVASGAIFGNQAISLPQGVENLQRPAGLMGQFGGIDTYQSSIADTQTVSAVSCYVGAVFDPSRALVGMWGRMGALKNEDTANVRVSKAYYMYHDFGIHWDEAIVSVTSPVA